MKSLLKYFLISISVFAIGTFLYAQTAVIGVPWELRGVNVRQGTSSTGQVFFRDGTGALPSISFISDPTTGFSLSAGPNLNFDISGIQRGNFGADFLSVSTNYGLLIGGSLDNIIILGSTRLYQDAANTLAQRNGVNAQTFRLYTSYTDATNYERLGINTTAGILTFAAETLGSGSDNITLSFVPAGLGNHAFSLFGGIFEIYQDSPGGLPVFKIDTAPSATLDSSNYIVVQSDVLTTDATTTTLYTLTLDDVSVYLIEARVVARCTGGAGGNAGSGVSYILKQAFKRSGGGIATAIGVLTSESWEDAGIAGWSAVLDVNGNNVRVRVTGAATDDASWHVTVFMQYLSS